MNIMEEDTLEITGDCRCSCRLPRHGRGWQEYKKLSRVSTDIGFYYSYKDASYRTLKSWHKVFTKVFFSCDDEYSEE